MPDSKPGGPIIESAQNPNRPQGQVLTWTATVICCAYSIWTFTALFWSMNVFRNMFNSMGVELPLLTRLLLVSYWWLFPLLGLGTVLLLVGKQFYVREKWPNLTLTFAVQVVVLMTSNWAVSVLYAPLFSLIERLSK